MVGGYRMNHTFRLVPAVSCHHLQSAETTDPDDQMRAFTSIMAHALTSSNSDSNAIASFLGISHKRIPDNGHVIFCCFEELHVEAPENRCYSQVQLGVGEARLVTHD